MSAPLPPHEPDHYPVIRFAVRHHRSIRWTAALAVLLLGLVAGWRTRAPDWIVLGAIGAVVVYLLAGLLLELVRLVADMLLPR